MWIVVMPWWMWLVLGWLLLPLYMLEMALRALVGMGRAYHHASPGTQDTVHAFLRWCLFIMVWPFVPLYYWRRGRLSGLATTWIYGFFIAVGGLGSLGDPTVPQPLTVLGMEALALCLLVPAAQRTMARQREEAARR